MKMSRIIKASLYGAALSLILSSCQGGAVGQNTAVGAGLGAAIGGLGCHALGGKGGACLAIAGAGALIGGSIGAQIDARDRAIREAALQEAYSQKKRVSWRNPKTGNRGTITPLRDVTQNGVVCETYKETYFKNGNPVTEEKKRC